MTECVVTVCKRVYYWGRVQGVGFRYTAANLARKHPVAGYVKNMADGQVELVAEGEAGAVDAFLQAVAEKMANFIKGQSVQEIDPEGFEGFVVRS